MLSTIEMSKLIILCGDNDIIAQERLYKEFYSSMLSVCLRYIPNSNDAVSVLNDAFLKVFKNISKWQGDSSLLPAWIKKILIHTALDTIRLKSEKNRLKNVELIDQEIGATENEAVSNINIQVLLNLIQSLPKKARIIFNLYIFENYSHKEISDELNIPIHTSQWYVCYARKILQSKILLLESQEKQIKM